MPCHPIHVIHTKPCQQVCNVWVWCQLSTHLTNLFVACIAWWVCVVVCSFTLVLMPHHQLCTPWAAMPWCVATSVFVLCVPCLPLCPQPPCCTIGVCVWLVNTRSALLLGCLLIDQLDHLVAPHTPFLLFVLQLVCCAVCGSACVATGVVCVGACCCTLPQSPSQALVNVAPGCPCVMLHHTCVCQAVLFGHTWLTTMWWTLLMLVSLAVHMWWLFVTT